MVRNAAHDSVCACSVDEVVDAVLDRYAEARRIGEGLADQALAALARSFADAGAVVVNPSARRRSGVVEMIVAGEEIPADTQAMPEEPGAFGIPRGLGALTLDADDGASTILAMLPIGKPDRRPHVDPGCGGRGGRQRDRHHDHLRERGTLRRPSGVDQAGSLHPTGSPARLRGADQDRPAAHTAGAGPGDRRPRIRVASARAGVPRPPDERHRG